MLTAIGCTVANYCRHT